MRSESVTLRAWLGVSLCLALVSSPRLAAAEPDGSIYTASDSSLLMARRQVDDGHLRESGYPDESRPEESVTCCPIPSGRLCPCSYFWAEGLILGRDNQSDGQPLVLDLNTNEVLFSTGDLDFDWAGGLRLGYGTRICNCWAIEFGYLGVFDNSASAGVELEDSLMLPGDLGLQVNNFFGADEVDLQYESDLHSFEANLVRCCCCCDCAGHCRSIEWLAGFRYLNFDEDFSISAFDSAEGTTEYAVETDNHLYGAQVGSRYRRCRGAWSWEATGKAGIYGNDMEQSQDPIIDFPAFVFRPGRESDDTDVAFVGDLNFTAVYQLTDIWGLRMGYNLIWIEGVALAADQLDFTNTPDSGTELEDGGGVFLHGVNVGAEARW
ncbi:MAG: BBP7 family outer membrane beta-barrel protein [Planctomycetes bacterium]|nr:BBP7 family outer membrane beta-barrel protein [Planctomycetota bacterium]